MKYAQAKSREEKMAALEEMISLLPRHHGSENAHAQLKSRLAKMKKEGEKKGATRVGIQKEGDAQVCLLGYTNSGKSQLLAAITDAKPEIAPYEYTTVKPEVGMMDWKGVKVQIIEIPSTFEPAYVSIARTAELIVLVIKNPKEEKMLREMLEDKFIRTKALTTDPRAEAPGSVKERIWKALGRVVIYTKQTNTPMSLLKGATVRDAAKIIHKDFIKNFRFARIQRGRTLKQVGLDYALSDGDVIEIYA